MKKLLLLGMLLSGTVAAEEVKLIERTNYATTIDQEVRERVFLGCVNAIKSLNVKDYSDLDDSISACGDEAAKIALRGRHEASDGYKYITVVPTQAKQ